MPRLLEVTNLSKVFGNTTILQDVSFGVDTLDVIAIIGPSGAGKSTLLRCLNLLERPTSGSIIFNNEDILQNDTDVDKLRTKIGMVFQSFNLFKHKNVIDNLLMPQRLILKRNKKDSLMKAEQMLAKVGLLEYKHYKTAELSGGMSQRVAIARALCMDPSLMLFDEPTSALDPLTIGEVLKVIRDLALEHMSIIIVTHEMNFAKSIANKIMFMENGHIIEFGPTNEVINSKNPKVSSFFKEQIH